MSGMPVEGDLGKASKPDARTGCWPSSGLNESYSTV